MNLIKTDKKTSKSFNLKTIFRFFVLFVMSASLIFDKIFKSFTKVFKIMYFNNVHAIIINDMQRMLNVILYK